MTQSNCYSVTYLVSNTHSQASHPRLESFSFFWYPRKCYSLWPLSIHKHSLSVSWHFPTTPSLPSPTLLTKSCALGNKRDNKSRFIILSVHLQGHGHGVATNTKQTPLCFNCQLLQPARDAKGNHSARCFPG